MGKPGPEGLLDKENAKDTFAKIKEIVFKGGNLQSIARALKVSQSTVYNWSCYNIANFSDKYEGWRRDRKLMLAENNITEFLEMNAEGDVQRLKIKADISKFVAETLGKQNYSKRNELTGADGGAIKTQELMEEKEVKDKLIDSFLDEEGDKENTE